jgi:hypothetical protein
MCKLRFIIASNNIIILTRYYNHLLKEFFEGEDKINNFEINEELKELNLWLFESYFKCLKNKGNSSENKIEEEYEMSFLEDYVYDKPEISVGKFGENKIGSEIKNNSKIKFKAFSYINDGRFIFFYS